MEEDGLSGELMDIQKYFCTVIIEGDGADERVVTIDADETHSRTEDESACELAEAFVNEFLMEFPACLGMKGTLIDLFIDFARTKDANAYFAASLNTLLHSYARFEVKPKEALTTLQRFFPRTQLSVNKGPTANTSKVAALSKEDTDVHEYIGGFLLRRIFYHPSSSDPMKDLLIKLKENPRKGSIAFEKNRSDPHNEFRLWGINDSVLLFLQESEVYFRSHITGMQQLQIDKRFINEFLEKPDIVELKTHSN